MTYSSIQRILEFEGKILKASFYSKKGKIALRTMGEINFPKSLKMYVMDKNKYNSSGFLHIFYFDITSDAISSLKEQNYDTAISSLKKHFVKMEKQEINSLHINYLPKDETKIVNAVVTTYKNLGREVSAQEVAKRIDIMSAYNVESYLLSAQKQYLVEGTNKMGKNIFKPIIFANNSVIMKIEKKDDKNPPPKKISEEINPREKIKKNFDIFKI